MTRLVMTLLLFVFACDDPTWKKRARLAEQIQLACAVRGERKERLHECVNETARALRDYEQWLVERAN